MSGSRKNAKVSESKRKNAKTTSQQGDLGKGSALRGHEPMQAVSEGGHLGFALPSRPESTERLLLGLCPQQ